MFTGSRDGDPYHTTSYPDYLDLKTENTVFTDVLGYSLSLDAIARRTACRAIKPAKSDLLQGTLDPLKALRTE